MVIRKRAALSGWLPGTSPLKAVEGSNEEKGQADKEAVEPVHEAQGAGDDASAAVDIFFVLVHDFCR